MGKQTLPPRLHQADNGWWYVLYHEHGRGQRTSLRTKDSETAKERFSGWLDARSLEELICADPKVSFVLDVWFEDWIQGRMLSEDRYPSVVNHLKDHFGKMSVSEVRRKDSREYIRLRRQGVYGVKVAADGTIRMELLKLRAALNFFRDKVEPSERRLDPKIIPYIELPPASPPRDDIFTLEELYLIYYYCMEDFARAGSKHSGEQGWLTREARFCIIAMETAQRKTAILELNWDQVDLDNGRIQFNPTGRNQTSKRRPPVPISDLLMPMLKIAYQHRKTNLVLDYKTDIHYGVQRIMVDLGLEGSPHKFRHSWASHAAMRGVSMGEIAGVLGDTQRTVEMNYLHLSPDYLRSAINRKPTLEDKSQNAIYPS